MNKNKRNSYKEPFASIPTCPQKAIEYFMFQVFGAYSEAIGMILPNMNPDTETPILLCRRLQHGHYAKQIICELYDIQIQFRLH